MRQVLTLPDLFCRSMFVSDRSFFMRDPARSLYSTAAYYLSIMTVNAAVTIINAAFLVLLMYGMIGEQSPSPIAMMTGIAVRLHSYVSDVALEDCLQRPFVVSSRRSSRRRSVMLFVCKSRKHVPTPHVVHPVQWCTHAWTCQFCRGLSSRVGYMSIL